MKRVLGRAFALGLVLGAAYFLYLQRCEYQRINAIYEDATKQTEQLDARFEENEYRRLELQAAQSALPPTPAGRNSG